MIDGVYFGRVKIDYVGRNRYRNGTPVLNISFWINDAVDPLYISLTTWLEYETTAGVHRIYNPLKISFDIEYLIQLIRLYHSNKEGNEANNFRLYKNGKYSEVMK